MRDERDFVIRGIADPQARSFSRQPDERAFSL